MIKVRLSPDELYQAVIVGCHKRIVSIFGRKKEQHYESPDNSEWSTEIESAAAELACAKEANRYWNGGTWDGQVAKSDVDGKQIRHTSHSNGCLLVYKEDSDNDVFILVTGRSPEFNIIGWMIGKDAKKDKYWRENCRKPCWWVPQEDLKPISPSVKKGDVKNVG